MRWDMKSVGSRQISAVQHQVAVAVAAAARRRGCRSSSYIGTAVAAPLAVLLDVGYGSCCSGSGFGGFGILCPAVGLTRTSTSSCLTCTPGSHATCMYLHAPVCAYIYIVLVHA